MMSLFDLPSASVQSGKDNEWYTPLVYIEAARSVLGGIDLDPASSPLANGIVNAKRYYTITDDGLEQIWSAESVWLNPPFARNETSPNGQKSNITKWVTKLVEHYHSGDIRQAILLTTTRTDTKWFRLLWDFPVCFADHHVMFRVAIKCTNKHGGYTRGHIHGTCFVYLGPNEQAFIEHFSQFGRIAKAIDTPKPKLTPLTLWEVNNAS